MWLKMSKIRWKEVATLFTVFLISFGLRVFILRYHGDVKVDASWYATSARDFLQGKFIEGVSFTYPPFYPMLIAIFSFLFKGDVVYSGRFVASLFSSLTILPVYFLAKSLFKNPVIALISGLLVSFQTSNIGYSWSVITECPYVFFMFLGVYFGYRSIKSERIGYFILLGIIFGAASLIKPEGRIYFLGMICWLLAGKFINTNIRYRYFLPKIALALVSFGLFVSPYLWVVHDETGTISFGGKGKAMLYMFALGKYRFMYHLSEDKTYTGAQYFFADKGRGTIALPEEQKEVLRDQFPRMMKQWKRKLKIALKRYVPGVTGVPLILLALCCPAITFFQRMNRRNMLYLLSFASIPLCMGPFFELKNRYFFSMVPTACIFAGVTVVSFSVWASRLFRNCPSRSKMIEYILFSCLTFALVVGMLFPIYGRWKRWRPVTGPCSREKVGTWLRNDYGKDKIYMLRNRPSIVFYAEGKMVYLPWRISKGDLVDYAELKGVDYLLADGHFIRTQNDPDVSRLWTEPRDYYPNFQLVALLAIESGEVVNRLSSPSSSKKYGIAVYKIIH